MLVRSEILGLFGNTLTADHMYPRRYTKEISATCSNAIISRKENIFYNFYCIFAICTNFVPFEKKDQLYSLIISELIDSENCGYLNARRLLFYNTLRQSTCSLVLNSTERTMAVLLSQFSIDARHIELENISVSQISNVRTDW